MKLIDVVDNESAKGVEAEDGCRGQGDPQSRGKIPGNGEHQESVCKVERQKPEMPEKNPVRSDEGTRHSQENVAERTKLPGGEQEKIARENVRDISHVRKKRQSEDAIVVSNERGGGQ
jgi:hypothetical protein